MKPFIMKNFAAKIQLFQTRVKGFWHKNSLKMLASVCAVGIKKQGGEPCNANSCKTKY